MSRFIATLVNYILKQKFALQATWSTRPSQGARVSTLMRSTLVWTLWLVFHELFSGRQWTTAWWLQAQALPFDVKAWAQHCDERSINCFFNIGGKFASVLFSFPYGEIWSSHHYGAGNATASGPLQQFCRVILSRARATQPVSRLLAGSS